jgi:urease accessory protein
MSTERLISLLQFADGLFPAGAYAHSFGLETCVQAGTVHDAATMESFLRAHLEGSLAPLDAAAAVSALRIAQARDWDACLALDSMLDAMKTASEVREASRQMGRQTLRIATRLSGDAMLAEFSAAVERGETFGHHPVVFGLAGGAMEWTATEVAAAYLYASCSALVGAALRLMPLGQLAGQQILWNVRPIVAWLANEIQERAPEDLWSFAPAMEIAAMQHATLSARLFRS